MQARFADELRRVYPRVLGKMLAVTRSLPDAEDAAHDAIERALGTWPRMGVPDDPEAWLVAVAVNSHRDRLRRSHREERHADAVATLARMSPWVRIALGDPDVSPAWKDDLLRVLFACCHPALGAGESAALALATVIGLSTREIALGFGVGVRTMEQRLTRARQRLRERGGPDGVTSEETDRRLDAVLRTVHLLFNEGYWSTDDRAPIRGDLCRLAVGLARSLASAIPDSPEVAGLLALLTLHDARREARLGPDGGPVPLPQQDRARWDRDAIASATALLERALGTGRPGPYQIEAAISAVHCRAATASETDWRELAALYELLESFRLTPAIRVNRAFALGKAEGAPAGLALLERGDVPEVAGYPYFHLVRGVLLAELGRSDEARAALTVARLHARNSHEATQIAARMEGIVPTPTPVSPRPDERETRRARVDPAASRTASPARSAVMSRRPARRR